MALAPLPAKPADAAFPVRVIVVDDSAVIRGFITRELNTDPDIRVVASASNGEIAIDTLRRTPADVIILDIEMPIMDGLEAIPRLKAIDAGTQIIMASTLTLKNADISIKAMSLGASDYIPKPSSRELANAVNFHRELLEKVKVLGALARRRGVRAPTEAGGRARPLAAPPEKKPITLRPMPTQRPDIIAIGSSTGGPQALFELIRKMGADLTQPIVITQHMPPAFTTILAEHISRQCNVACTEGKDGEVLKAGHYYVAPGDFHMLIERKAQGPTLRLTKDPAENFCRPAVDPMLRSLVDSFGSKILTVILTGMGSDGQKGGEIVAKSGGSVIAQDEASSIVWGMPGAAATSGICSAVLPLLEIGAMVRQIAGKS